RRRPSMSYIKSLSANLSLGLSLTLILAVVGIGQTITGTISGTVVDPNGGVVPAANVTLTSTQTGAVRNAVTNEEGRFTFPALQPGMYTIVIEHSGFQKLLREKVVLSANENLALGELALAIGSASETVTVTGGGATVELESSDLTARLTSDQIDLISTK